MTINFRKLDKFEGHDFRRWQKKIHFLLTTLKVVYVLTTLMPELMEDDIVEAIRRRAKWENDDYICRGHILNGMSDSLFDIYQNVKSAKELWDSLESKYMAEDASNDIMESVISCDTAKDTWTDLVHSFEGPSYSKENMIMDLTLEYQTFRAKPNESLSQSYTRYKTLLNELANDGVNLSKHEINAGFVNSLLEKWLTFSQGLRNANHTQTLYLADIYRRDFQENSDDEDEEEVSDNEQVTQVKVLMALADDELTIGKNHARNGEWIDITMRKVNILLSMDEDADWQNYLKCINIDLKFVEEQRLNLLSKYNKIVFELNKCRDELLILKQAKLDDVTFQIQNTELTKLNHALQEQLKEEKKINENG
ncbi:hypothetical protein Tco_0790128 [Tanacetum coccineum]